MTPELQIVGSIFMVTCVTIILTYAYWWWCDVSDYRRATREAHEYYLATEDDIVYALANSTYGTTLGAKLAMQKLIHAEQVIEDEDTKEHYYLLIPMQVDVLGALQIGGG